MRTADEVHVVLLQEARNYIWTKGKADTSIVLAPSGNVLVWVGPKEIAEKTAVGNLSWLACVLYRDSHVDCDMDLTHIGGSHDAPNLLHGVEIWAETAVHGEDLLVDDGGNGQAVEAVGEGLPQLDVVSSLALIVETVDAVDRGTLVVTAEDEEVLGVLDLVGEEQADGLERLLATVDVITKEEVVGLRRETTVLEQTQEVVVLAVDITTDLDESETKSRTAKKSGYLDGSLKLEEDGLGNENLAGSGAEVADLGLEKLDLLAGSATADFEQSVDDGVEIDVLLIRHYEKLYKKEERGKLKVSRRAPGPLLALNRCSDALLVDGLHVWHRCS